MELERMELNLLLLLCLHCIISLVDCNRMWYNGHTSE